MNFPELSRIECVLFESVVCGECVGQELFILLMNSSVAMSDGESSEDALTPTPPSLTEAGFVLRQ